MFFIVLGWLSGSSTFEETQHNIHVFKGKCTCGRCSFWEVLEINRKGPQEKSVLWELERRCTGQGGSPIFPTSLFVGFSFITCNFPLLTALTFARWLPCRYLLATDHTLTAAFVWTRSYLKNCSKRPSVRIFIGGKSLLLSRLMNMSRDSYSGHRGAPQLLSNPQGGSYLSGSCALQCCPALLVNLHVPISNNSE